MRRSRHAQKTMRHFGRHTQSEQMFAHWHSEFRSQMKPWRRKQGIVARPVARGVTGAAAPERDDYFARTRGGHAQGTRSVGSGLT